MEILPPGPGMILMHGWIDEIGKSYVRLDSNPEAQYQNLFTLADLDCKGGENAMCLLQHN